MKNGWLMTLVIPLLLLLACASAQERRQDYVDEHPELPQKIASAIMEGSITKEMSKDEVRAAWGEPKRATLTLERGVEQDVWSYEAPVGKEFKEGTVILTFTNGKLISLIN
ncbi:MAG: hypothetical protein RAO92_06295 [Candidatus Euphemobacter frigidus]|nr:hypothetical protein [Candidatus Euphemobacter frigidus]MDP8275995.1 hypothetical protein [Candidatus Euphemobacter frigidus]